MKFTTRNLSKLRRSMFSTD